MLLTVLAVGTLGLTAPVEAQPAPAHTERTVAAKKAKDPRRTRGLFVDRLMPAAKQGGVYRTRIGTKSQAFWVIPEAYPTGQVRSKVRAYTKRALAAKKTPVITVYGIPGRDCGSHSSGNPITTAAQYRKWIAQISLALRKQRAIVILEPDALPLFSSPVTTCATKPAGWQAMLRYASKTLTRSGAWVYLDAGHSNWTPYDTRAAALKSAGIAYARGFSTNVSNFRSTTAEKKYAAVLLKGLSRLKVRGKHYVIDTSRNGAKPSADGNDVINPRWARVGKAPRLVFRGAFDGTLWVKHPGESDGPVNDGPSSGRWCDRLADRLLSRVDSGRC